MAAHARCSGSRRWLLAGLTGWTIFLVPTASQAYLLNTAGSWSDPAFSSSVTVSTLATRIEYAVFSPGAFDQAFGSGSDPSKGAEFVYTYQLINNSTSKRLKYFSVGLDFLSDVSLNSELLVTGGTPCVQIVSSNASAVWSYDSTGKNIPIGGISNILLFVSPYGPETKASSTLLGTSGVTATNLALPRPAPEPATLMSLATAGLFLVLFRSIRVTRSR